MTRPVPGGYLDRQLLNQAIRANKEAQRVIGRILQDRPGPERLAILLAQMAHLLGDQGAALREMEAIRLRREREVLAADVHTQQIERLRRENERLRRQVEETRQIVEALERLQRERGGE